jgi:hypothetical protein
MWHELCPWPNAVGSQWQDIASYLHDPETRIHLADDERERRYPDEVRRRLHSLGLHRFLADSAPSDETLLTVPHICSLNALLGSVNSSLAISVGVNKLALLPAYNAARGAQLDWLSCQVAGGAFASMLSRR